MAFHVENRQARIIHIAGQSIGPGARVRIADHHEKGVRASGLFKAGHLVECNGGDKPIEVPASQVPVGDALKFIAGCDDKAKLEEILLEEQTSKSPRKAVLVAIESKLKTGAEMLLYSVNAITSGSTESQGEVTVRLQHSGRVVNGVGADPDIVVASAKAYLAALNKLHSKIERVAAQG